MNVSMCMIVSVRKSKGALSRYHVCVCMYVGILSRYMCVYVCRHIVSLYVCVCM
jgi:hypothetical protein